MSKWQNSPFHMISFASYPLLALLAANLGQVNPGVIWRPLAITLIVAFIVWLVLSWLLRQKMKSGIIVSWLIILFFSYGHVYEWGQRAAFLGGQLGRHRYLVPIWLVLFGVGLFLVKRLDPPREVNRWLNTVGLFLIILPLIQLGIYGWRVGRVGLDQSKDRQDPATGATISLELPEEPPDVYYLVLDAYTRSDVLDRSFGIDNSDFLSELEAMGFEVAECSQSNYSQTELAFASTLNMAYLEDLGDNFISNRDDRTPLRPLIKQSLIRRLLEDQGYQTVAFETGFPFSELTDADVYIAPRIAGLSGGLSGFETLLLRSSGALILLDASEVLPRFLVPNVDHEIEEHRQRTILALNTLENAEQIDGPKFVFAHIVSPHTPFIFGSEGTASVEPTFEGVGQARQSWYRQGYAEQIEYLNGRVLDIIEGILTRSETAPVIIIQGDHGPEEGSSQDRMRILNAYYIVGGGQNEVDSDITPVNSFRLVLNQIFGEDLPLLPDKSLFSTYNRPYEFNIIENSSCQPGA